MSTETTREASSTRTWGECLRSMRLQLGLSQEEFVDEIMLVCLRMNVVDAARFERLRLECPDALPGNEISRYENGKRLPLKRSFHLLLIWIFVQSGVLTGVETTNDWLELGQQGWLTDRERRELFG